MYEVFLDVLEYLVCLRMSGDCMGMSGDAWGCLGMYGDVWGAWGVLKCLGMFEDVWDFLRLYGGFWR